MISIQSPSRLHFGFLNLSPGSARRFGGVGVMVQAPGIHLTVSPALSWSSEGPLSKRVLDFAQRLVRILPSSCVQPHHLQVHHAAPEHMGLGTGTQLGLSVARALMDSMADSSPVASKLARQIGRGARSALGIHGFEQGGFLVEGGKARDNTIAPLVVRHEYPGSWPILLVLPSEGKGQFGLEETQIFQHLKTDELAPALADQLCRIVLLGILPALVDQDWQSLGEAVHEFNVKAGQNFAPFQGGPYASSVIAEVISFIRSQGIAGTGQSSWGPAIFALLDDRERAETVAAAIQRRFNLSTGQVFVTAAANHGAAITRDTFKTPRPPKELGGFGKSSIK